MPEKGTLRRAQAKRRAGKAPSTQAGEFVREEMHHARSGKHRVESRKQAIAIGLSKARRSGFDPGGRKRGGARAGSRKRSTARRSTSRRAPSRTAARSSGRRRRRSRSPLTLRPVRR